MASFSFELGSAETLVKLFTYPNRPGSTESLSDTILHWVNQMLARDGFAAEGGMASVRVEGTKFVLDLNGSAKMKGYVERLPLFLKHGGAALDVITGKIMKGTTTWPKWVDPPLKDRLWDPWDRGTWRFFLPIGMAMVRQKVVNYFHYPPMRLLEQRDYLADPVPVRLIELMKANGIATEEEAWLYSTVMDGAPIAAPDDEGTIYHPDQESDKKGVPGPVHLLPTEQFRAYQKDMTELLLNTSSVDEGYTIPIVVYGTSARESFNAIWKEADLSSAKRATRVKVLQGKETPVICSGHPYAFFAQVQTVVGSGEMKPEAWASGVRTMMNDLAVIRWQINMAKNPKEDPAAEWTRCREHWENPAQLETVYELVLHEGSLWYPNPKSLDFVFRLSRQDVAVRARKAAVAVRKAQEESNKRRAREGQEDRSIAEAKSKTKPAVKKPAR